MKKGERNIERCLKYFDFFCKKDLNSLENIFSDEIILRDWEIHEEGKSNVLLANKRIFDSVESIDSEPINIYSEGNTVIAELQITINNSIVELIVDVISFDDDKNIINIRAYKG